ncbi:MAG: 5'(3')-deoxyribonucleotidase [Terrimonas sp.]|nr:5'(3')-deoxyribonucleotidase [Terrimonas sp.]
MQRIVVDMDGVLADVAEQFFRYDERDFGIRKEREAIAGKPELEVFKHAARHVLEPGFFRTAPVIKDSQAVLEAIHQRYEVFIVSAATEFPQSLSEKQTWLNEHFPYISWKQMVFCGLKTIIEADLMIDDHFKNLDHFKNSTFLFTQPHNLHQDAGRHKRVDSWSEIGKILL